MAGFPRERRVRRGAEIRAILAEGRSFDGSCLRLHAKADPASVEPARAAVVVPRHGHTAVERNRLKRRLREIVRLHVLGAPELTGAAVVVRTRPGAYLRTFAELRSELLDLLGRVGRRAGSGGSRP
ncbi:MAG: ribonuclease P protein component [Gemmatimonadota bacterium]